MTKTLLLCFLLAGAGAGLAVPQAASAEGSEQWLKDSNRLTAMALKSMVRVVRTEPHPGAPATRRVGSGIVFGHGRVLTCAGLVGSAREVLVAAVDGDTLVASVRGVDRRINLAVLEVPGLNMPVLEIQDDPLIFPGTWVLAVGLGKPSAPRSTFGSVVVEDGPSLGYSEVDIIQTTNPLFAGYTGGALLNREGKLLGLVSGVMELSGDLIVPEGADLLAGFVHNNAIRTITPSATTVALPMTHVKKFADQLWDRGYVERAYLGLEVELSKQPLLSDKVMTQRQGVMVHQVVPCGPVAKAGLLPGDFIVEFAGARVENPDDLAFQVASRRPGAITSIRFLRRGQERSIHLILEQAPPLAWEPEWDRALAGRETGAQTDITR